ncbi:sugar ABC transporter substrate-binding protein [Rhodococcus sp. NPDC059968]|uniref:sugar ABC transporter substrate-binding protein n=1 Tax=Rhodococcus sp. NPDC059968 TaxID=3347017 RepID=UPI003672B696
MPISLVALAAVALTGCSTGAPSTTGINAGPGEPQPLEDLKIGVFIPATSNAYLQAEKTGAEETAKKAGIDLTVVASDWDPQRQNDAMMLAMQRKTYDAWIVNPISPREQCSQIKDAAAQGIKVLVVVTAICGDDGYTDGTLGFIGEQNAAGYRGWWKHIFENTDPGKLAAITGPDLDFVTMATQSALESVQPEYPDHTIASFQKTDYLTEEAFAVTQTTLKSNPDLKAVASNYSGMTRGVVQAVQESGKSSSVKVFDSNGDAWTKSAIESGTVKMALPGTPYTDMKLAVEMMMASWQGQEVAKVTNPLDQLQFAGAPYITKDNVASWVPEY